MLRLCGPAAEKPKVVKSFLPQKSPAHAVTNAENGAFLAHLELEILLIEVAHFSAATEYTFSAHCIYVCVHTPLIDTSESNLSLNISANSKSYAKMLQGVKQL